MVPGDNAIKDTNVLMKNICFIFIILAFMLSFSTFHTETVESNDQPYFQIADETLRPYFEALKNGDVVSIKKVIAGKMLQRNLVLLDQNKNYPDFLRDYYQSVEFSIMAVELADDDIQASVSILFPGNESVRTVYILHRYIIKDASGNPDIEAWKIVRQIEE
jgi:hypothetical protein